MLEGEIVGHRSTATLVNNTAKTETITLSSNERWMVYAATILNADDVARNIAFEVYNSSAQLIYQWFSGSVAASTRLNLPIAELHSTSTKISIASPFPVKEGWSIKITWAAGGASAGGTADYAILHIKETA